MPLESSLAISISEPRVGTATDTNTFTYWISATHPHADFHADCAFIHADTFYLCTINIFIKIQCDPQLYYHHSPTSTFPKELVPSASSIPIISRYVSTVFQSFTVLLFLLYLLLRPAAQIEILSLH